MSERPAHTVEAVVVAAILLILLGCAMAAYLMPLGRAAPFVAMAIAAAKATLVALYYMDLRRHAGAVRLAAAAGLLWVSILFILTLADYLTRG